MKINFNVPYMSEKELEHLSTLISHGAKFSGDGEYTAKCRNWFGENHYSENTLLTTSCTHALEMAALISGVQPGDEVILPSYTFVSSASAFVLRGAKIKFVDIDPKTMNLDLDCVENAITKNTKVIVPVHYGGTSCDMDRLIDMAQKNNIFIVEDAAQCIKATYKGKHLGTIGDMGCLSFHDTKNIHCGEGGAIILNDKSFLIDAEMIREKGTDRSRFLRGDVDKYTWRRLGSSYLLNDLSACFLLPQLETSNKVTEKRVHIWNKYYEGLKDGVTKEHYQLAEIPDFNEHNAHLFFMLINEDRPSFVKYLREKGIVATSHYEPLHTSPHGEKIGDFIGEDKYTSDCAARLVRLPMHYYITDDEVDYIVETIKEYFA